MPDGPGRGRILEGVLLLLLLHALQLLWVLEDPAWLWLLGVTQLAYAVPAAVVLAVQRRWRTAVGVGLGVVATALVNVCAVAVAWGVVGGRTP